MLLKSIKMDFQKICSIMISMFSILILGSLFYFSSVASVLGLQMDENLLKKDYALLILENMLLGTCILCMSLIIAAAICYIEKVKKNQSMFSCLELVESIGYKPIIGMIVSFGVYCCLKCQFLTQNEFLFGNYLWELALLLIFVTAVSAIVWSFSTLFFQYDNVDVSLSLHYKKSIGAAYAWGAYDSYYNIVAKEFISKLQDWEKENKCYGTVKKLIIICPLSCNVEGSLDQKSEDNIKFKDSFVSHIGDQGANMNRVYKHTIYDINSNNENTCVVAEFASPLGTLWERKLLMEEKKFFYIRDCFIKTLKFLLKDYPFIVVEYDEDSSVLLDKLILSVVERDSKNEDFKMKDI